MKDVNDYMPKFPNMRWGALFNWRPKDAEIDSFLRHPPFPDDRRWHTVQRDISDKDSKYVIVDGHPIRQADDSKLT